MWLNKNQSKLFHFLNEYVAHQFRISFAQAAESYQKMQYANYEEAWDYVDLRDLLQESMEGSFCEELYTHLQSQKWFDQRFFSKEEVAEFCLNLYIMDSIGE